MFAITEARDESLEASIVSDRRSGFGLLESLERRGLMRFDEITASQPWEIDEERDTAPVVYQTTPTVASSTPKEYIGSEIARNKANAGLFIAMVRIAYGKKDVCVVGHHIAFELGDDFETLNEIPSADTLIFDHVIMRAVFGDRCIAVMQKLAALPVEQRDAALLKEFTAAGHKVSEPTTKHTDNNDAP